MEKFSQFRDPGTGIQPFLTPLHTAGPTALERILSVAGYPLAIIRTSIVLVLLLLYVVLVRVLCLLFIPIRPLYNLITYLFTAVLARLVLALVGLPWINVEQVSRKRGRGTDNLPPWNPAAGDLIISNWCSWIDILYLAFRWNPIFVLPVTGTTPTQPAQATSSGTNTPSPGRSTGTGSANLSSTKNRTLSTPIPIIGFRQVSLLTMIRATGKVPPYFGATGGSEKVLGLHEIRKRADRPVVVFPECTASNGRGMIRFANILPNEPVPVKSYKTFLMCFRYDPPTPYHPTLTHSMPSASPLFSLITPLPHIFKLTTSFLPSTLSIRLLALSSSPCSPTFITSEVAPGVSEENQFIESCGALVAQMGKMKRTAMGWEDKRVFLEFWREKRKLY